MLLKNKQNLIFKIMSQPQMSKMPIVTATLKALSLQDEELELPKLSLLGCEVPSASHELSSVFLWQ